MCVYVLLIKLFIVVALTFRNGIITMCSPWMTPRNSFYTQPRSFEYAPFLNRLNGVLRAGRTVTTILSQQR